MKNIEIIIFFFFCVNIYIICHSVECSKDADGNPYSKYHCSGLNIVDDGDTYCCLWKFFDTDKNKSVARCSSISDFQFNDLDAYITKKKSTYQDLDIQCTEDQEIYCSNILMDQEHFNNCNDLPVSDPKDKYCCRWQFTDNNYDAKQYDYCASVSEYQYMTIYQYVNYKEDKGDGKYDYLSIDCSAVYINNIIIFLYLFLFICL